VRVREAKNDRPKFDIATHYSYKTEKHKWVLRATMSYNRGPYERGVVEEHWWPFDVKCYWVYRRPRHYYADGGAQVKKAKKVPTSNKFGMLRYDVQAKDNNDTALINGFSKLNEDCMNEIKKYLFREKREEAARKIQRAWKQYLDTYYDSDDEDDLVGRYSDWWA
jgi:hypothetical protein